MFTQFLNAFDFALTVTLPSIFLLIFGYLLNRLGQIDANFCHQASRLMFNWALPALLFFAIIDSKSAITGQGTLLLAGAICALILFIGAEIVANFFIQKRDRGVFVQGIYRGNTAIIGLAFCANAYGSEGLSVGAVFTGTMTVLYNILAVITLSRSLGNKKSILPVIINIIKNPLIIGITLAGICRVLNISLPQTVVQSGPYLSSIALPLALICIGATFDVKAVFSRFDFSLWTSIARVIVAPLLAVIIGLCFGLDKVSLGVLFLMSSAPVAAAAYVMVRAMGGNDIAMANIVALTTVLSMLTTSLWIVILRIFNLM